MVSRASEVSDLGILENANSMWLNGFQLPEAQNLQASLGYGIQLEMGRLQAGFPGTERRTLNKNNSFLTSMLGSGVPQAFL